MGVRRVARASILQRADVPRVNCAEHSRPHHGSYRRMVPSSQASIARAEPVPCHLNRQLYQRRFLAVPSVNHSGRLCHNYGLRITGRTGSFTSTSQVSTTRAGTVINRLSRLCHLADREGAPSLRVVRCPKRPPLEQALSRECRTFAHASALIPSINRSGRL